MDRLEHVLLVRLLNFNEKIRFVVGFEDRQSGFIEEYRDAGASDGCLRHSLRRATTGSFFAALRAGNNPDRSVSAMLRRSRKSAFVHGSMAICRI